MAQAALQNLMELFELNESKFDAEVPELGDAALCYCFDCTDARAKQWLRDAVPEEPRRSDNLIRYNIDLENENKLEEVTDEEEIYYILGDKTGSFDFAAIIIQYGIVPKAMDKTLDILDGSRRTCKYLKKSKVLVAWARPNILHPDQGADNYIFKHMDRVELFKMFRITEHECDMPDLKYWFDRLKRMVVARQGGKFKNNLFVLQPQSIFVADEHLAINPEPMWFQYWRFLEQYISTNDDETTDSD